MLEGAIQRMNIFIVYCHPSENSFTFQVKEAFLRGIVEAGHHYVISDLYAMGFRAEFSEQEYIREAFYEGSLPLPADVLVEQAYLKGINYVSKASDVRAR